MLDFIIANGGEIITGVCGVIGIIISSIITKKKCQGEDTKLLQLENKKLQEELKQLKDIAAIDSALDKSHGSIYYETMPDGSRRSLCGFCWEQSHKKIPLKTYISTSHPRSLAGCCAVCKASCSDTLEPQHDYSSGDGEQTIIW